MGVDHGRGRGLGAESLNRPGDARDRADVPRRRRVATILDRFAAESCSRTEDAGSCRRVKLHLPPCCQRW